MRNLRRENVAAAADDLAFALTARTLAATCGGKVDFFVGESLQHRVALLYVHNLVAVDGNLHFAARKEFRLCKKQQRNKHQNDYEEHAHGG